RFDSTQFPSVFDVGAEAHSVVISVCIVGANTTRWRRMMEGLDTGKYPRIVRDVERRFTYNRRRKQSCSGILSRRADSCGTGSVEPDTQRVSAHGSLAAGRAMSERGWLNLRALATYGPNRAATMNRCASAARTRRDGGG